jgi:hypothetical protein
MSAAKSKPFSPFEPRSIPGLAIWSDASALVGSTGTTLTSIPNYGIAGPINCTGTIYNAGRNGLNTVRLTASGPQIWKPAIYTQYTAISLFFVGRQTGGSNNRVLNSDHGEYNELYGYWGGYKKALFLDAAPNQLNSYPSVASDTLWDMMSLTQSSGAPFNFKWNGTSILSGSYSTTNPTTFSINAPYEASDCEFGEILIYNNVLTDAQVLQVEGYLAQKWGMTIYLPATVPYYLCTPVTRAFQPIDITGLALWLDGADASSITLSGTAVTQWNDKSGNGRNATQGTSGNRPTFTGSGVIFNASNNQFLALSVPFASTHSVFIVASSTSAYQTYLFGRNYAGSGPAIIANYTNGVMEYYSGSDGSSRSTFTSSMTATFIAGYIRTYNSSLYGRYNGAQVFSAGGPTSEPSSMDWGYLGDSDGSHSNFYTGTIYEFMIFNTALTTAQATQIEGYLAQKWGLVSLIPQTIIPTASSVSGSSPSGLQIWLDATTSSTLNTTTNGGSITTWNDKTANGFSFTTTASGTSNNTNPQYSSTGLNGYPAIYFPTADSYTPKTRLTSTSAVSISQFSANTTDITIFIVCRSISSLGGWQTSILEAPSGGLAYLYPWYVGYGSIAVLGNSGNVGVNIGTDVRGPSYIRLQRNGSAVTVYGNGQLQQSGTANSGSSFTSSSQLNIGGGYSSDFYGYIGEFMLYNRALTTTEVFSVETYLAAKWGLATPYAPTTVGHPFSTYPPYSVSFFQPTQISGCALWLDASDNTTISYSSGYNVSTWGDKSGNGSTGSSIGFSGSTVWSSNSLNGYATIVFDGSTGSIAGSITGNTGTKAMIFVVASMEATYSSQGSPYPNQYGRIVSLASSGILDYNTPSAATFLRFNYAQAVSGYRNSTNLSSANITYGVPFIGVCLWDGSSNYVYVNGTAASGVASSGSFAYYTYNIGRTAGSALQPDSIWKGNISEVIVFNTVLSSFQRQQIEGYLANKWGLQSSLPSTHPFVKIPPAAPDPPTPPLFGANFSYTGSVQYWTAPAGVSSIFITLKGAGGAQGYGSGGGAGGLVSGTLAVSPGTTYAIIVGNAGIGGRGNAYGGGGAGGAYGYGGGGGGRTAFAINGGDDLVTAGAGGGGAYYVTGGAGGGNNGGNGNGSGGGGQYSGGYPSTSYGYFYYDGMYGGKYYGGDGGYYYGGGGGSGWYGGGGGGYYNQCGAGGSSYVGNLTGTIVNAQGSGAPSANNGSLSLTY